jgi:hypothetical protein
MRVLFTALLALLIPFGAARAQRGPAPDIWFGPLDPIFRAQAFHLGFGDFNDLFRPGAPWQSAAAHVSVFKLSGNYVAQVPEDQLRTVVQWVRDHHMLLAMESAMLTPSANCGHVEGYGSEVTLRAAQKIRNAGGTLDILSAGESLWFGHFYTGPSACRTPIPEVVANQVRTAKALQQIFPNIRIDDIEPISNFYTPSWVQDVGQWLDAFRQQFGAPYAGVELDIGWWIPGWQPRAQAIARYLRSVRMPIRVIYNGNSGEQLAYNWVLQAGQHWREYEKIAGVPNSAIFQSWNAQPNQNLPETSNQAFTSDLIDYERAHMMAR